MTDIIKQLNDVSVINTYKVHDLLDKVLGIQYVNFPENEIKFDQERIAFVSQIGENNIIVQRDMNTFTVVSRVVKGNDILAECVISVDGGFNEKYARMDPELKKKVSAWFTEIGIIDVNTLITGEPAEAETAEPEAEPETVEAEVVAEG
jgi:hypothetical protein